MAKAFNCTLGVREMTIKMPPNHGTPFAWWRQRTHGEVSAHLVYTRQGIPDTGFFLFTGRNLRVARITVPAKYHDGGFYDCFGYITRRNQEIATWVFDRTFEGISLLIAAEIEEFLVDPNTSFSGSST